MEKTVLTLTKANMTESISSGLTLVDFWADWCGPCKMLAPILDELYSERNDFQLAKIDVDSEQSLAMEYGISNIPTVILFRDGKPESTAIGVKNKAHYESMLTASA